MILTTYQRWALDGLKLLGKIVLVVAMLAFLGYVLTSCSKAPTHVDPVRDEFATGDAAHAAAVAHAVGALGQHVYGPTHGTSMEPLIVAGDWLVLQERAFSEVREGRNYGYMPKPGPDFPNLAKDYDGMAVHRAVGCDSAGVIMAGDNAPRSDSNVRMTAANLVGECIYVAHVKR